MSNINTKNIISENINVTNLNVTYINGKPYSNNTCCNKGYYVACQDCNYSGPDECGCGNTCEWCDEEYDECGCNVPCPDKYGPTGPTYASSALNYFFDLVSGADNISVGQGPGFIIDTPTINGLSGVTGAFIYPSSRYFSDVGGGLSPWSYTTASNNSFNSSNTEIFYTMPFNGEITAVSVNTLSWFDPSNGQIDIIRANNNTFTRTNINLPSFSSINPSFPITGYTTNISNPSFNAGEGLACILLQENLPVSPWTIPYDASTTNTIVGNIDVTIYIKFTS
jgi:hypothetical protein